MKLSNLKTFVVGITTGFCLLSFIACNNSEKSGNNSTTEGTADTMSTNTATGPVTTTGSDTAGTATRPPGKRTGKVVIKPAEIDKTATMKADDKGYYNYTETAPVYPGGLETYIVNNIVYPEDAVDNGVEGTVFVMFTIDENGKVGNAKTSGSAFGYGLEDEAVRVVKSMSAWTPGMNKGKKVNAWYTLPITFKLEE